jgi:hypothetical protein
LSPVSIVRNARRGVTTHRGGDGNDVVIGGPGVDALDGGPGDNNLIED